LAAALIEALFASRPFITNHRADSAVATIAIHSSIAADPIDWEAINKEALDLYFASTSEAWITSGWTGKTRTDYYSHPDGNEFCVRPYAVCDMAKSVQVPQVYSDDDADAEAGYTYASYNDNDLG
jgi:hypothetical protein